MNRDRKNRPIVTNGITLFKNYTQSVLAVVLTFFIAGGLVYVIKDYRDKIDDVEKVMQKHHGLDWVKLDAIIETVKITERLAIQEAKHEDFKDKHDEIFWQISGVVEWGNQMDAIFAKFRNQTKICIVGKHYGVNTGLNEIEVNKSNHLGSRLKIGDKIELVNMESLGFEKMIVVITGEYVDFDDYDLTIRLGNNIARVFGIGDNKIMVRSQIRTIREQNWQNIDDMVYRIKSLRRHLPSHDGG